MNEILLLELIEEIKDYEKLIYVHHSPERYWNAIQTDVSIYLLAWDDFKTQQLKGSFYYEKSFTNYNFKSFIPVEQTSVLYIPFLIL